MARFYTLILGSLFFCSWVSAQQTQHYTMYMFNKYAYNPAYAGLDNSLSLTGVYRKQWVGLSNDPESLQANAHMPVYYLRGGLGVNVANDLAGAERNTSASVSYNYWLPLNKTSLFSIGFAAGIIQKSLDGNLLRTPEGTFIDGVYTNHNDNFLPAAAASAFAPTFNLGLYFRNERIEAGFSVNNLTEPKITLDLDSRSADILYNRNYFLTLGLNFDIGSSWTILPSIFAQSDLTQTEIHFSTIIQNNDNIFGGVSFRGYNSTTVDAVALLGGLKLNERVSLSYSYDLTLSALKTVSRGSHEVLLNYNLNKPIGKGLLPKIIYNPRYN